MDLWLAAALVDLVLDPAADLRPAETQPRPRTARDRAPGDSGPPTSDPSDRSADAGDPKAGRPPDAAGDRAGRPAVGTVITVTIPIDSLAGLTDDPGVINGFGVIPAEDARRLAAGDARWRHVLTCRPAEPSSTSAPCPTGHPPRSPGTSASATAPADSPAAPSPPPNATSTT